MWGLPFGVSGDIFSAIPQSPSVARGPLRDLSSFALTFNNSLQFTDFFFVSYCIGPRQTKTVSLLLFDPSRYPDSPSMAPKE